MNNDWMDWASPEEIEEEQETALLFDVADAVGEKQMTSPDVVMRNWAEECTRPIAMSRSKVGSVNNVETIKMPCGSRRQDKCASCSERWVSIKKRQLNAVLKTKRRSAMLLLTTTQPSFGQVYSYGWTPKDEHAFTERMWKNNIPAPKWEILRDIELNKKLPKLPKHRRLVCTEKNHQNKVGTPLNPANYDYTAQLVHNFCWNLLQKSMNGFLCRTLKDYMWAGYEVFWHTSVEPQNRLAAHAHTILVIRYSDELIQDTPTGRTYKITVAPVKYSRKTDATTEDIENSEPMIPGKRVLRNSDGLFALEGSDESGWKKRPAYEIAPKSASIRKRIIDAWENNKTKVGDKQVVGPTATVPKIVSDWGSSEQYKKLRTEHLEVPGKLQGCTIPKIVHFGEQFDVQILGANSRSQEEADMERLREVGYVAKYVSKSATSSVGAYSELPPGPRKDMIGRFRAEALALLGPVSVVDALQLRVLHNAEDTQNKHDALVRTATKPVVHVLLRETETFKQLGKTEASLATATFVYGIMHSMEKLYQTVTSMKWFTTRSWDDELWKSDSILETTFLNSAMLVNLASQRMCKQVLRESTGWDLPYRQPVVEMLFDEMDRHGTSVLIKDRDILVSSIPQRLNRIMDYSGGIGSVCYSGRWVLSMKDVQMQRKHWAMEHMSELFNNSQSDDMVWGINTKMTREFRDSIPHGHNRNKIEEAAARQSKKRRESIQKTAAVF